MDADPACTDRYATGPCRACAPPERCVMDAVEKAAEALRNQGPEPWQQHGRGHTYDGACIVCRGDVGALARAVLDAVGYPAHQSSDEGTCWCPVAEQAARERDAAREEVRRLTAELDAAQLRSIEARNPGIDMDEVRRRRETSTPPVKPWGGA